MRPISNVVDVSNYVMLELGQPNHAYDLDRLPGGGLLVRRGREGETIVTLDEVVRHVGPDDCLICDAEGTPVGVGGIMGGASSEISDATTTVLLESAWFRPDAIARTSKRLGLRSEASVRFERGVDPEGARRAAARFVELLTGMAGGEVVGGIVDVTDPDHLPAPVTVAVRTARVNSILGTDLTSEQVRGYLEPIGFATAAGVATNGTLAVTIPSWRPDSEREIDVIEEVARHHGYSRIPRTRPPVATVGLLNPYQRDRRLVADILVGVGLSEAWATSFLAPDDLVRAGLPPEAIEIENPLAAEESILRPSLLPGLLQALVTNANHRRPDVALFEIGHVFLPPARPASASPPSPSTWRWCWPAATRPRPSAPGGAWPPASASTRSDCGPPPAPASTPPAPPSWWRRATSSSEPSARSTPASSPPTSSTAPSAGSSSTWAFSSATPPAARPPTAPSAATRRPTSTSPSWSTTTPPRATSSAPCGTRPATWSSRWSCSTSTGARASSPAAAASPSTCAFPPSTTPSPRTSCQPSAAGASRPSRPPAAAASGAEPRYVAPPPRHLAAFCIRSWVPPSEAR